MHQSLPGTPKSLKGFRPVSKPTSEIKTFGKTITYRDMPWHTINLEEKYHDPYSQVNLIRTQSALGLKKVENVREIVEKSR